MRILPILTLLTFSTLSSPAICIPSAVFPLPFILASPSACLYLDDPFSLERPNSLSFHQNLNSPSMHYISVGNTSALSSRPVALTSSLTRHSFISHFPSVTTFCYFLCTVAEMQPLLSMASIKFLVHVLLISSASIATTSFLAILYLDSRVENRN